MNLNELVSSMLELVGRTLGAQVALETRLDPALWPCRIDPVQMEVALLNLLTNAGDAMPRGGRVTIASRNRAFGPGEPVEDRPGDVGPGEYVEVVVADSGEGMPPEVVRRAIERFFTTEEVGAGTRLGPSTVYGFVKQSRGHLAITSEIGAGTAVRLLFPAARAATGDAAEHRPERQAAASVGETVLAMDDNPDVLELAVEFLAELGYRVLTAADGRQALEVVDGPERIDLLFTDFVMPGGMNGVTLAQEARRRRPRLRVLLTTGYAEAPDDGRVGDGFEMITKPYRRGEAARRARQLLDGKYGGG